MPTRGGQAGSARPAPGSRRPGCLVPLSPSVAQDGDPRVVARRTAFLVFQRKLDRSGGGRPGPRRLRGTVWAGAARPGQAPGAQGLQGSGDVARQPRFQACGTDDEGTPGAWSREGLVAARLHAKAAGQGQVGRKVLVSWAPGPVVGGSFPFVRKVAAPVRQKACTRQGSPVADSQTQAESCRPAKQPSGPGLGTRAQVLQQVLQPPGDSPRGLAHYFLFS